MPPSVRDDALCHEAPHGVLQRLFGGDEGEAEHLFGVATGNVADIAELAAYQMVASLILNLDGTITRN